MLKITAWRWALLVQLSAATLHAQQAPGGSGAAAPTTTVPPTEAALEQRAVVAQAEPEPEPAVEPEPDLGEELLPEKPRSGWAALPVAVYAPETQLGAGAFGSLFFRLGNASAETRPSSLSVVGLYTMRKQLIAELIPELYWNDERWHLWTRLDYRRYPNRLWAIGPAAPQRSEETYQENRPRWQLRFGHAVIEQLYIYAHLEALHLDIEDAQAGGLIDRGAVPGARGGRSVGLGPGVAWDTRDHLLVPHHGVYHQVVLMTYQPGLGSEYRVNVLRVNLRRYVPVTRTHTLALQYFAELQEGEVPFYMLAQLGGQNLLRGYFEGRYRDKALMAFQAEYRLPLFWRLGGVLHAGLGDVASALPAFGFEPPKWSMGGGLRLLLNRAEQLNLRADAGFGHDTFGIYVSVAEAY